MEDVSYAIYNEYIAQIRNLIAKTLDDMYKEVAIEPPLVPLTGEVLDKSANVSDEARLDIAARDF